MGGAVRDQLLGYPVTERDWVVVGARPEQLAAQGFKQVGKDFPVFLHPKTKEEYALARTERKTQKGYAGFTVHADSDVSLVEDLRRRDLTINAMAMTPEGQLIDPYHGQQDLELKLLRHVSSAFVEDPLRILRVARLAARYHSFGFRVADETMQLMQQIVRNGEVEHLVKERVFVEMHKALSEDKPSVFFSVLKNCGALAILFPEIQALFGVPQRKDYHPEVDTGIHTLMVLDKAAELTDDVSIRFAGLMHDLGKGETPQDLWPKHHGHEERSALLTEKLCQRLSAPTAYLQLSKLVARYHTHCHRAFELRAGTLVDVLGTLDAFRSPDRFEKFLIACKADSQGRTGFENEPYPQMDYMQAMLQACLSVTAKAFIEQGLQGKAIGEAIREARIKIVAEVKKKYEADD